jgi:hypothetical protein
MKKIYIGILAVMCAILITSSLVTAGIYRPNRTPVARKMWRNPTSYMKMWVNNQDLSTSCKLLFVPFEENYLGDAEAGNNKCLDFNEDGKINLIDFGIFAKRSREKSWCANQFDCWYSS